MVALGLEILYQVWEFRRNNEGVGFNNLGGGCMVLGVCLSMEIIGVM